MIKHPGASYADAHEHIAANEVHICEGLSVALCKICGAVLVTKDGVTRVCSKSEEELVITIIARKGELD